MGTIGHLDDSDIDIAIDEQDDKQIDWNSRTAYGWWPPAIRDLRRIWWIS
jgi:hypothetical protein